MPAPLPPPELAGAAAGPVVARHPDDVAAWGTVLGIWAHPDDEAYLCGGLMALAAEAGNRVVCVTATRGEHGTDDPRAWPPERLARRRAEELRVSLTALGVEEHRWLWHADGECAAAPLASAAAAVAELIDEVRPDTIVTFGPDGFTGHPDHVAVSRWVERACDLAGTSPARVWWAVAAESWATRYRSLHERVPVFGDARPVTVPDERLVAIVDPTDVILDRKMVALRAQRSQTRPLLRAVGEATYRRWWAREHFAEAGTTLGALERAA